MSQYYLCSDCAPCEPTCSNSHAYCTCLKVAGLSGLYYTIAPAGNNTCVNGVLANGVAAPTGPPPRSLGAARSAAVAPVAVPLTVAMHGPARRRGAARFVSK